MDLSKIERLKPSDLEGAEISAYALLFAGSSDPAQKPDWIESPEFVEEFNDKLNNSNVSGWYAVPLAQHPGLVRLKDGAIRKFNLYKVHPRAYGYMLLAGGRAAFNDCVSEMFARHYNLSSYDSSLYSKQRRAPPPETAPASLQSIQDAADSSLANYAQQTGLNLRVVFYDADEDADYVRTLEASDPTGNTWAFPFASQVHGNGWAAYIYYILNSLVNDGGHHITQLIIVGHGAGAVFDIAPDDPVINTQGCVGLVPGNVSPTVFGQHIAQYLAPNATITLVTCDTAGTTVYAHINYQGTEMMQELATAANAAVLATNDTMWLTDDDATPERDGGVWLAVPYGHQAAQIDPPPQQGQLPFPMAPYYPHLSE